MLFVIAAGKPGSAMASLAKAGVAGANPVQVVLNDSPVFLAQVKNNYTRFPNTVSCNNTLH